MHNVNLHILIGRNLAFSMQITSDLSFPARPGDTRWSTRYSKRPMNTARPTSKTPMLRNASAARTATAGLYYRATLQHAVKGLNGLFNNWQLLLCMSQHAHCYGMPPLLTLTIGMLLNVVHVSGGQLRPVRARVEVVLNVIACRMVV